MLGSAEKRGSLLGALALKVYGVSWFWGLFCNASNICIYIYIFFLGGGLNRSVMVASAS